MEDKLIQYIQKERKKNISDEIIKEALKKYKWDDKLIESSFEKLKSDEYNRDSDVLHSDDFEDLEAAEFKKLNPITKIISKSKQMNNGESTESKAKKDFKELDGKGLSEEIYKLKDKIDSLHVDIDKIQGKIEIESDTFNSLNERISDLSEQIGEQRSTILSRERFFDKMELEFEQMKTDFLDMRPSKIQKEFEIQEENTLHNTSKIDRNTLQIQTIKKQLDQFEKSISKIKSFDSLFNVLEKLDSKIKKIEDAKRHIELLVNKSETIFIELKENRNKINSNETKLDDNMSISTDNTKDIDRLNVKVSNLVKKSDLDKINKDLIFIKEVIFGNEKKEHKQNE